MAKQIIEKITDDIDGSEGAATVTFGFNGKSYEIDLGAKNSTKLEKALTPFIEAAREVRGEPILRRRGGAAARAKLSRDQSAKIRTWAKDNGLNVSERGRIAADVVAKYEAAH
ncbi:Lsr2 family protein [Nonomuraea sp. NPDC059007]|uniref:histone-like nucleoid-structuring protein Lsr2 n=1 Tax=Nonomuraea sp. NPDC059007 TaxID=3346692 RepID=UPI0036A90A77